LPSGAESVEGNSNSFIPFDISSFYVRNIRIQQVYGAAAFNDFGAELHIESIAFRRNETSGIDGFDSIFPDVRISLSTTSRSVDGLADAFIDNLGPDEVVVHDGPLRLTSAAGIMAPNPFDIVVPLQQIFVYRPAEGNLLMDVINLGGGFTAVFDAVESSEDDVSLLFSDISLTNPAFASTGRHSTNGLVTKFAFEAIPEPTSLALSITN
jgi:hypothetical protein